MQASDQNMVQRLCAAVTVGAFAGMALLGWIMFFDVSSIGTMMQSATLSPIFSTLVIGGSLLKGGLLGFAVGLASCDIQISAAARRNSPIAARVAHA